MSYTFANRDNNLVLERPSKTFITGGTPHKSRMHRIIQKTSPTNKPCNYFYQNENTCFIIQLETSQYEEALNRQQIQRKFSELNQRCEELLKKESYTPSNIQSGNLDTILSQIEEKFNNLNFVISADEDIALVKENEAGFHYILIPKDDEQLVYVFTGRAKGNHFTIGFDSTFDGAIEIASYFINA